MPSIFFAFAQLFIDNVKVKAYNIFKSKKKGGDNMGSEKKSKN